MGRTNAMGRTRYPERQTLPPHLAAVLAGAKTASGLSFRDLEQLTGLDNSYICKLTKGTRLPSREVVQELVDHLPLTDDTINQLMAVAKVKQYYYPPKGS